MYPDQPLLYKGVKFAEELRTMIEEMQFTPQKIHTTASIDAAVFPKNAGSEKELLLAAKEALYDAQHRGRNKIAHP